MHVKTRWMYQKTTSEKRNREMSKPNNHTHIGIE